MSDVEKLSCPDCGSEFLDPNEKKPSIIKHPYFTLDTNKKIVTIKGKNVHFSFLEIKFLEYLVENPDRTIVLPELMDQVWDYPDANTRRVKYYVNRIRDKFEASGERDPIITMTGWGYRLKTEEDILEEQALESANGNGNQPQITFEPSTHPTLAFQSHNPSEISIDNDTSNL